MSGLGLLLERFISALRDLTASPQPGATTVRYLTKRRWLVVLLGLAAVLAVAALVKVLRRTKRRWLVVLLGLVAGLAAVGLLQHAAQAARTHPR